MDLQIMDSHMYIPMVLMALSFAPHFVSSDAVQLHVSHRDQHSSDSDVSMCHNTAGWDVTFEDEFDGVSLNASNWWAQDNNTHGSTERELYVASAVAVANGTLILTTKAEHAVSKQGVDYNITSGWVESSGKQFQKFGRFEVRAKLPTPGVGRKGMWPDAWPAHWLMPEPTTSDPPNVCWPVGGEIDIMEGFRPRGGDNEPLYTSILMTYHWAKICNKDEFDGGNALWPLVNDTKTEVDWSTTYHTYTVEWNETKLSWFVDGELRHTRTAGEPANLFIPQWPFYMILNTAMTPWSAATDPGLPTTHVIDRVTWCQQQ
eukprot:m.184325 g.184325  ORF g.184325 m.184325 type:complete len:317 (-) comp32183_c0_seq1:12-962(-)